VYVWYWDWGQSWISDVSDVRVFGLGTGGVGQKFLVLVPVYVSGRARVVRCSMICASGPFKVGDGGLWHWVRGPNHTGLIGGAVAGSLRESLRISAAVVNLVAFFVAEIANFGAIGVS